MKTELFAVIGHPIGHTMSPFIHKRLFSLSGLCPRYEVLDVENVPAAEEKLRALDGFNITIPHKRAIIPLLDEIDEKAKRFGSVNTVRNDGGRLKGFTTDGAGCLKALENHGTGFQGDILILGNGGAARAVAFEALGAFKSLTFAVRDLTKGDALIQDMRAFAPKARIRAVTFSQAEEEETKYRLLINTTSVGMYPSIGVSPVSASVIGGCDSVFDAVYNPGVTELLKTASALHKNVIGGMEMLVYQAAVAHRHWYGGEFEKKDIEKLCLDAEAEMKRIFYK